MTGSEEFFACFVERFGRDEEDDAAIGLADEVEATLSLDELELAGHGRSGSIHRIGLRIKIEVKADDGKLHLYQIGT